MNKKRLLIILIIFIALGIVVISGSLPSIINSILSEINRIPLSTVAFAIALISLTIAVIGAVALVFTSRRMRAYVRHEVTQSQEEQKRVASSLDQIMTALGARPSPTIGMQQNIHSIASLETRLDSLEKKLKEIERMEIAIDVIRKQLDEMQGMEMPKYSTGTQEAVPVHINRETKRKSEQSTSDDPALRAFRDAYERSRGNERFVPIARIIDRLIKIGAANSPEDATRMIYRLERDYPNIVRIGTGRGDPDQFVAINETK